MAEPSTCSVGLLRPWAVEALLCLVRGEESVAVWNRALTNHGRCRIVASRGCATCTWKCLNLRGGETLRARRRLRRCGVGRLARFYRRADSALHYDRSRPPGGRRPSHLWSDGGKWVLSRGCDNMLWLAVRAEVTEGRGSVADVEAVGDKMADEKIDVWWSRVTALTVLGVVGWTRWAWKARC
jgi:hypothetical protein